MSKSSEGVKIWRTNFKKRLVQALGGKCIICGYARCIQALELHHVEPTKKEFTFGEAIRNPRKWDKVKEEAMKCLLLCANCHREVHNEVNVTLPTLPAYDFSSAEHTHETELDPCPICSKLKPVQRITCSRNCAAKKRSTISWESIDLRAALQKADGNYSAVGREHGVTGNAVKKQFKKQQSRSQIH